MSELNKHRHTFRSDEWPFAQAVNTPAFTSVRVSHQNWPVLMVYHDHDGDWQFHCGFIEHDDEPTVFCLGCIFEKDPTVGAVADLPAGWMASREKVASPWKREPFEEVDE